MHSPEALSIRLTEFEGDLLNVFPEMVNSGCYREVKTLLAKFRRHVQVLNRSHVPTPNKVEPKVSLDGMIDQLQAYVQDWINNHEEPSSQVKHSPAFRSLMDFMGDLAEYADSLVSSAPLEKVPFILEQVVQDTGFVIKNLMVEAHTNLWVRIAPDIPEKVMGDPSQVSQLLFTVLQHAMGHYPEGTLVLELKHHKSSEARAMVVFDLYQLGVDGQKINRRNCSVENHDCSKSLALLQAEHQVKAMGGVMTVSNTPGLLNTRILLPLEFEAKPKYDSGFCADFLAAKHILVVANKQEQGEAIGNSLVKWGCSVSVMDNALGAIYQLDANDDVDMVLLDTSMPISCSEIVSRMRLSSPKLPILGLMGTEKNTDCQGLTDTVPINVHPSALLGKLLVNLIPTDIKKELMQQASMVHGVDLSPLVASHKQNLGRLFSLVQEWENHMLTEIGKVRFHLQQQNSNELVESIQVMKQKIGMVRASQLEHILTHMQEHLEQTSPDFETLGLLWSGFMDNYNQVESSLLVEMNRLKDLT